jgi:hypothetical protein
VIHPANPNHRVCLNCTLSFHRACSAPLTCACACSTAADDRSDAEEWDREEMAALLEAM